MRQLSLRLQKTVLYSVSPYCATYICLQGMVVLSLCRGKLDVSPSNIPEDLPDSLRDFLHKCLHPNELLRLPAHELLCHPFITPSPSPLHPRPLPPSHSSLTVPANKIGTHYLFYVFECQNSFVFTYSALLCCEVQPIDVNNVEKPECVYTKPCWLKPLFQLVNLGFYPSYACHFFINPHSHSVSISSTCLTVKCVCVWFPDPMSRQGSMQFQRSDSLVGSPAKPSHHTCSRLEAEFEELESLGSGGFGDVVKVDYFVSVSRI